MKLDFAFYVSGLLDDKDVPPSYVVSGVSRADIFPNRINIKSDNLLADSVGVGIVKIHRVGNDISAPQICSRLSNSRKTLISHFLQLAAHNAELFIGRLGLTTKINRQRNGQGSDSCGRGGCNKAVMPIKASYREPDWTLDKPLSILGCALIIAFGYFSLAWGIGALLLWRNPLGLLSGGVALLLGIACIGHGFWTLVH